MQKYVPKTLGSEKSEFQTQLKWLIFHNQQWYWHSTAKQL